MSQSCPFYVAFLYLETKQNIFLWAYGSKQQDTLEK